MTTATDRQKAKLIRKYHTLCTKIGMTDDERREMLADNYGVESSKDLYVEELEHLCTVLDTEANTKECQLKEARRRVFGAVGGWLDILYGKVPKQDILRYRERIEKIKAIACRQTEYKDFNKIPLERLANISFLFSKKQKDYKKGSVVADIEVERLKYLN
ncbi:MAG: phage protein GemA/Gp16 family protein [Dysgonomonas sp.]|uniref:phage protein GemA/Gp16 family protein n=1 Tax=Dysgonomonas sp. TaxID=1891233 RepID=UPI003A89E05B